jgi:cysteine-rich repeat protein
MSDAMQPLDQQPSNRTRRAPLHASALFALCALLAGVGSPALAATFIAFHSPEDNGQALGPKPNPPALGINVGATATLILYVELFDPAGSIPSGDDGNGIPRACVDGPGGELCGWLLELAADGMRIDSFTDSQGDGSIVSLLDPGGSSLNVAGGSASGELGPVKVGTLQVTALSPNSSLELRPGSFIDAAGNLTLPSVQTLAVSVDTCGNGTIEAPEECDDGNALPGDGCFATCRVEDGFAVSGTAQGGTIDLTLAERSTPLVGTTIAGESADVIAGRMAVLIDDDPEVTAAARSAESVGNSVVTDATLLDATSNDPGLSLMPEPGGASPLLIGALGVLWLGRARSRR